MHRPPMKSRMTLRMGKMLEARTAPAGGGHIHITMYDQALMGSDPPPAARRKHQTRWRFCSSGATVGSSVRSGSIGR